jgi:(p)ppGpp synthase/HD superfamily hydrolase
MTHSSPVPDTFSPLIEKAIEVASVWHDRTYRKGRWRDEPFDSPGEQVLHIPVISHLTSVGMILQRAGWDDRTVAAGILHDMIEDANRFRQSMSYDRLRELIGAPVADLVEQVSEPKIDTDGKKVPWRRRKEVYLEKLRGGPVEAVAISAADKVHNLWTMNQAIDEGINVFESTETRRALSAGPREQLWFFCSVLEIAERHEEPRLNGLSGRLRQEVDRFRVFVSHEEARSASERGGTG